ncbi:MerR family transcriptional regulator [Alcanivorax sp. JB21]|uniref:MerR family transcriptional regulator n=1 Tax=Alcanivorax limicola TaxID=2874102 RepID=UPI001CBCF782|nr:MerR family transcriptional regulator [Alcanivorax limicola]MBZ2190540.1 MerR family transcriptional regulator [Alcanivorax limicola]
MRIAELERRTGVGRHALRYYEKQGLLVDVYRGDNNYREYPEAAVAQVNLLRQLQTLGFSLKEIRQVLLAMRAGHMDCAEGAQRMAEQRKKVDAQIASLRQASKLLAREQRRLEESAARQRAEGEC